MYGIVNKETNQQMQDHHKVKHEIVHYMNKHCDNRARNERKQPKAVAGFKRSPAGYFVINYQKRTPNHHKSKNAVRNIMYI